MNEMRTMDYRDDYRENYRDYRDDYRDYRDEYGRNQRDEYGRNRRNYRNYRNYRDEYTMMLEDAINDGMELARTYEDLGEISSDGQEKQKLMKIAEREKEHYRTAKEIMQKRM